MSWDVFVSHATEDKEVAARPLAEALRQRGLTVWLDEAELRLGDSLRKKIDEGLRLSRFGVVVLSHAFFSKEWPQAELDGLVSRELSGTKVLLPVWSGLTVQDVRKYSPLLAGRLAARLEDGLDRTVEAIVRAIAGSSGERLSDPGPPSVVVPSTAVERERSARETETEIVVSSWRRSQRVIGLIGAITAMAQHYPDLGHGRSDSELRTALAPYQFTEAEVAAIVGADDKWRALITVYDRRRLREANLAAIEFNNFLIDQRPFLPPDLWRSFSHLDRELRGVLITLSLALEHNDYGMRNQADDRLASLINSDVEAVIPKIRQYLGLSS